MLLQLFPATLHIIFRILYRIAKSCIATGN